MISLVLGIYVARQKGQPMDLIHKAVLRHGGILNDRYSLRKGSWSKPENEEDSQRREVTIFTIEDVLAGNRRRMLDNLPFFDPKEFRRNLFIAGIEDIEALLGRQFQIGSVILEGTVHCTPCDRPSVLAKKKGFKEYFHGGIRAKVIKPGGILRHDLVIT